MSFAENDRVIVVGDPRYPEEIGAILGRAATEGEYVVRFQGHGTYTAAESVLKKVNPVKRFVVFGYSAFEAGGGWNDFDESFERLTDAVQAARQIVADSSLDEGRRAHVVDLAVGDVVYRETHAKAFR